MEDRVNRHLETIKNIRMAGKVLKDRKDETLDSLGITSSQSDCILFVHEHRGCTISDLRDGLEVSHQAACGIVSRMEAKDILAVSVSDTDGRARNITLTPKGEELSAKIRSMGYKVGMDALRGFSDEEIAVLDSMMARILSNRT